MEREVAISEWLGQLRELLEKKGFRCAKCENEKFYWVEKRLGWQCSKCKSSKSLRGQTVMRNSKLPIEIWYNACLAFITNEGMFSNLRVKAQLGLKRYQTAHSLMHRIRIGLAVDQKRIQNGSSPGNHYRTGKELIRKIHCPAHRRKPKCHLREKDRKVVEVKIGTKTFQSECLDGCKKIFCADTTAIPRFTRCERKVKRRRDVLKRVIRYTRVAEAFGGKIMVELSQILSLKIKGVHKKVSAEYLICYLEELNFFILSNEESASQKMHRLITGLSSLMWIVYCGISFYHRNWTEKVDFRVWSDLRSVVSVSQMEY